MSEEQLPPRKRIGKALTILGIALVVCPIPVYVVIMVLGPSKTATNLERMTLLIGISAIVLGFFLYIIPTKHS